MVNLQKLKASMDKACNYLLEVQEKDGSWNIEDYKYRSYNRPIILTSEAAWALSFNIKPAYVSAIRKGLNICFKTELKESDQLQFHSWKLLALDLSNSQVYAKERENLIKFLIKVQTSDGYWPQFPEINLLINFFILFSLRNDLPKENKYRFAEWLKNNQTKDAQGWSIHTNVGDSKPAFTSEAVLALIECGESPTSEIIQKARRFIESEKTKDGYWTSWTTDKPSPHTTAISALALMITSENPFNKHVEDAIKYLLSSQSEEGYFGRKAIHPFYYVNWLFSFYIYLKNIWETEQLKMLRQNSKNIQGLTNYIFRRFNNKIKERVNNAVYASVIDSHMLGTTKGAIRRRQDILQVLNQQGSKTTAEIIDALKKNESYKNLSKKSHLTQIKSDVEFLRSLNIIDEDRHKYYSNFKILDK